MATREQIETLKIDENVFELAEGTKLEYHVQLVVFEMTNTYYSIIFFRDTK